MPMTMLTHFSSGIAAEEKEKEKAEKEQEQDDEHQVVAMDVSESHLQLQPHRVG